MTAPISDEELIRILEKRIEEHPKLICPSNTDHQIDLIALTALTSSKSAQQLLVSDEELEKLANEHSTKTGTKYYNGEELLRYTINDPDMRDSFIAGFRACERNYEQASKTPDCVAWPSEDEIKLFIGKKPNVSDLDQATHIRQVAYWEGRRDCARWLKTRMTAPKREGEGQ